MMTEADEIVFTDTTHFEAPEEKDFLPNMARTITGVPLSVPLIYTMVGAMLIAFPSFLKVSSTASLEGEASNGVAEIANTFAGFSDLLTGGMFLVGMVMSMVAMFKFKLHAETGGGTVENDEYIDTLYKNLDKYDTPALMSMAEHSSYQETTRQDIRAFLSKKREVTVQEKGGLFDVLTDDVSNNEVVLEENTGEKEKQYVTIEVGRQHHE